GRAGIGSDAVAAATQPSNPAPTCTVSTGAGVVGAEDVVNVAVVCSTESFSVGGTVSGLVGRGLVLEVIGADTLPIASNGAFTFPDALASGPAHEIIVSAQPDGRSRAGPGAH